MKRFIIEVEDDTTAEDIHYACYESGIGHAKMDNWIQEVREMVPRSDGERRMTVKQRDKLWAVCGGYNVPFREDDYFVYSPESTMMAGWAEGWVGGRNHATGDRGGTEKPTIYVGVSPEGDSHT